MALNTVMVSAVAITLPQDGKNETFSITAQGEPVIVNDRWRIQVGESGTFRSYRIWPFKKLHWRRIA